MKILMKAAGALLMAAFAVLTYLAYRDSRKARRRITRDVALEGLFALAALVGGIAFLSGDDDD